MVGDAVAKVVMRKAWEFRQRTYVDTKVSKEDRQKMAGMHTKMAECLKSDKAMSDCQMMKSCKSMMGKDGCPMMGHMNGMMKGGMMNHDDEDSSKE